MTGPVESLLTGFPVRVEQAVLWGEMDAFRHVNNVVYFRYFENARVEYLRQLGWALGSQPVGTILASIEARFRRPLTYPDTILIGVRVTEVGPDRLSMEHRIVSRNQQAVTTDGHGVIVTYDYAQNRKAPVPDEMRKAIETLEAGARPSP